MLEPSDYNLHNKQVEDNMKAENLRVGLKVKCKKQYCDGLPFTVTVVATYPSSNMFDGVVTSDDPWYGLGSLEKNFDCTQFKRDTDD